VRPLRALLVAWDYPHAEHATGAAVARRVRQVASAFAAHGWEVDVIIREHFALSERAKPRTLVERFDEGAVTIHCVPGANGKPAERFAPLRILSSGWHALRIGDRTGRWGRAAIDYLRRGAVQRPDIVVGFYTPRGPLLTAAWASRHWSVPWIADLQDEWSQGSGPALRPLVRHWMRRTLKRAARVVQVSPEWAQMDRRALGRPIEVVRHAVPVDRYGIAVNRKAPGHPLTLLYSGSLNVREQDPRPLLVGLRDFVTTAPGTQARLAIACTAPAFDTWKHVAQEAGVEDALEWVGWLNEAQLTRAMREADALVLVPLATPDRPGVPSKLFAYLATGTPVLIAGPDSGGLTSLFSEWKAPDVLCSESSRVREALTRLAGGDRSLLLERPALGRAPVDERSLGDTYLRWAAGLARAGSHDHLAGATPAAAR
jgi:glycosyltransferase involved in cell wall biosynthesis